MVISLVPKAVAKKGYQFTHVGGTETCQKCKLLSVCINSLEIGSTYEVTKIRENEHICLIDDSIMAVCEVIQKNDLLSVKYQKYLDGVVLTREPIECIELLCENYDYCVSPKYNKPAKIKIMKNLAKLKCPLDYNLVLTESKRIEN